MTRSPDKVPAPERGRGGEGRVFAAFVTYYFIAKLPEKELHSIPALNAEGGEGLKKNPQKQEEPEGGKKHINRGRKILNHSKTPMGILGARRAMTKDDVSQHLGPVQPFQEGRLQRLRQAEAVVDGDELHAVLLQARGQPRDQPPARGAPPAVRPRGPPHQHVACAPIFYLFFMTSKNITIPEGFRCKLVSCALRSLLRRRLTCPNPLQSHAYSLARLCNLSSELSRVPILCALQSLSTARSHVSSAFPHCHVQCHVFPSSACHASSPLHAHVSPPLHSDTYPPSPAPSRSHLLMSPFPPVSL